jgi:hypothetical protein
VIHPSLGLGVLPQTDLVAPRLTAWIRSDRFPVMAQMIVASANVGLDQVLSVYVFGRINDAG